ncbi:C2 domain-containing protein 3-like [Agrilus planipennis]|uniref:C2 domain-containing protein 3-like n=1 Tax=Agrilus planipennis TaxID=224129 RepID=A0A7F5RGK1_AGRPL|nr:C2 domain-containing protein 3-like [Agrilus planipennis]
MSEFSYESKDRERVTNEVLKRVQRLRNQIVESILDNNPFDVDFICPKSKKENIEHNANIEHRVEYSHGGSSTIPSGVNFFDSTSRTNTSEGTKASNVCLPLDLFCTCEICETYTKECLKLKHDSECAKEPPIRRLKHKSPPENPYAKEITKKIQDSYRNNVSKYLKYIDCVKVTVHSLVLNQDGIRKLTNSQVNLKNRVTAGISTTYFVEYNIPNALKSSTHIKSRTGSRIDPSVVRICAKKLNEDGINFKQSHVHDVINLNEVNLKAIDLKFKVSSRSPNQKLSCILGTAVFNLGLLEISKNLSCTQDLPINGEIPINVGYLNVSIQFGCGRLYFGKEFIDAVTINSAKETHVVYASEDDESLKENKSVSNIISEEVTNKFTNKTSNRVASKGNTEREPEQYSLKENKKKVKSLQESQKNIKKSQEDEKKESNRSSTNRSVIGQQQKTNSARGFISKGQGLLLHGFIYISEVQYLLNDPINSYIACYPFAQEDRIISRTVYRSLNPVFNFYQKLPFLLEDDFLLSLRNNFMLVEFWQRNGEDSLIGTAKLPLHQLFICYRHADIIKQLSNNQYPVVTSDWWEPIHSHPDNIVRGHVKALVALGTEKQISNLEIERGLKECSLPPNFTYNLPSQQRTKQKESSPLIHSEPYEEKCTQTSHRSKLNETYEIIADSTPKKYITVNKEIEKDPHHCECCTKTKKTVKEVQQIQQDHSTIGINTDPQKFDAGIQVDPAPSKMESNSKGDPVNKTHEMLGEFLSQLMEQRNKVSKDTATNTDNIPRESVRDNSQRLPLLNNISPTVPISNTSAYFDQIENNIYKNTTNLHLRSTSDLLDSLHEALKVEVEETPLNNEIPVRDVQDKLYFKTRILVEEALHLPMRKKCRSRKNKKKHANNEIALPRHYVTFEVEPNAQLKITPVEFKTTNPRWDFKCEVFLPSELLTNSQKRLIFKVWRQNGAPTAQQNLHTDGVVGFAAVDLTVLLAGLPFVQGWFNIIDFSGKCNGQIKICVTPLESITRFTRTQISNSSKPTVPKSITLPKPAPPPPQEPSELLNNALKRKFQELEEINQRLRSRLANVIQEDSDSNDDFSEAFESDINMLCVEDDFDTIDFDKLEKQKKHKNSNLLLQLEDNPEGAKHLTPFKLGTDPNKSDADFRSASKKMKQKVFAPLLVDVAAGGDGVDTKGEAINENDATKGSIPLSESLASLDQQLQQGKERVDNLLHKISLIAGNNVFAASKSFETNSDFPFSSRYVSGCSVSQTSDHQTDPTIENRGPNFVDASFDTVMFEKLCSVSANSSSASLNEESAQSCATTGTSVSDSSLNRPAPDGAGSSIAPKSFTANTTK